MEENTDTYNLFGIKVEDEDAKSIHDAIISAGAEIHVENIVLDSAPQNPLYQSIRYYLFRGEDSEALEGKLEAALKSHRFCHWLLVPDVQKLEVSYNFMVSQSKFGRIINHLFNIDPEYDFNYKYKLSKSVEVKEALELFQGLKKLTPEELLSFALGQTFPPSDLREKLVEWGDNLLPRQLTKRDFFDKHYVNLKPTRFSTHLFDPRYHVTLGLINPNGTFTGRWERWLLPTADRINFKPK